MLSLFIYTCIYKVEKQAEKSLGPTMAQSGIKLNISNSGHSMARSTTSGLGQKPSAAASSADGGGGALLGNMNSLRLTHERKQLY